LTDPVGDRALRSFARTWTLELKDRGIRVNLISPGPIDTNADVPAEMIPPLIAAVPAGRLGRPNEIATAALFLASEDSSFVRGHELFVDGGMVAA
jgi:NAD(P)-dependent dehydrogenase (short-subunit alcohol dehydrogenase family)